MNKVPPIPPIPTSLPTVSQVETSFFGIQLTKLVLGWTIVFCPKFFNNLRYLNEILAGPKLNEGDLGPLRYVSFEQTILHEVSSHLHSILQYDAQN